ncbi:LamG-like jellyroll fold domain-containing protein [Lacinutrix himadriensis]|uniref:LamG-like jellyroll fold domain-containing protein n=1 Tax=Lacinutrix himadriensis TaxID=641549 RepID=UPI0009F9BC7A|nr:LamG-like jellyroll fold domain-containing protein [Lacinutrix himadriensis]
MKNFTFLSWLCALIICMFFSVKTVAQTTISNENFNYGWGIWNDGGTDSQRLSGAPINGSTAIELRDNTSSSLITTNNINLTSYGSATISFDYRTANFWWGLDFWVQYSSDGGSTWTNIGTYANVVDFPLNNTNYAASINIGTNGYTFSTNSKFRIRCDADSDWNKLYIDNVKIVANPPAPEIDVKGNNNLIPDGDTTPLIVDNTNFGSANSYITITRPFTIHNTGTANLNISSISLSNTTDFTIVGTPYATPVGIYDSTTFSIRYNALTVGEKTTTVTINNNDDDESTYQFQIIAKSEEKFFDSDGDGVYDSIDIDDDNDGIRDSEEQADCQNSSIAITANYKFLNETFGATNTRTTINTNYNAETTYCYEDGSIGVDSEDCPDLSINSLNDGEYTVYHKAANGDGTDQTPVNEVADWADDYWYTAEDHTPGDTNGRMAMFNASYAPGIFYTASITGALPNTPVTYSFWVLNLDRSDAPGIATRLRPNILVEFRDVNNNVLASITTGDITPTTAGNTAGDWYQFTADLTFPVSEFNVYFINNELGGQGNDLAIDDITISQTLCDTDSDGVADIFDLDSDNDGIPDVVEAGLGNYSGASATLTNSGSWLDANGNGMHDLVEMNLTLDSDNDGTPNYLDLDSDNDAIFDVDESGAGNSANTSFQNGDGDIDGDGVGDGPDSDTVRPTDLDSDNTLEYYTDGILDIYDYYNGGTFNTAYGNTNQGNGNFYYVLDTDNDGTPDYIDTTSDGATYDISHTLYSDLDANNDGVIDDTNDAEGDGIVDLFDTSDSTFGSPRDINKKLLLYFDGRNDYVEDAQILSGATNASIMGWVKIDPTFTGRSIVFGQSNLEIEIQDTFQPIIFARANSNTINTDPTVTPITKNQWIHLAATYDGPNGTLKLYINGEEVNNTTEVSSPLNTNTFGFTMGRAANFYETNTYFKGALDEVRVFQKTLSENELQKIVYQEIEKNSSSVRGRVIPKDITDFIDESTINPLTWNSLLRYYRLDQFKGDITDNLTTSTIDTGSGAKLYNIKVIDYQTAPMPFLTKQSGDLATAVNTPEDGVNGNDAITYDWSIVKIRHSNVTTDAEQKHLGLFISELDASSNPVKLKVSDDSGMSINWYLKLDGIIDLEGESQLVQGPESELDVTSKGAIEKDQQGTKDYFTYNYWSSPVGVRSTSSNNNSYTLDNNIFKDGTNSAVPANIQFVSGHNGSTGSPLRISSYWIWKFNNRTGDDYASWQHIGNTGSLLPGEGFTMKGVSNTNNNVSLEQNYVIQGKPNNGDISLPIHTGNDYLVGNPYPSAIDAEKFILDNGPTINGSGNTTGTLYFWEHWGGGSHILADYQGGYATYNLAGGAPSASLGTSDPDVATGGSPTKIPGKYIPVAQGFFVTGEANGSIKFNNSQRVFHKEDATNSIFIRTDQESASPTAAADDGDNRTKIRLGFNSTNTIHRQLLITVDQRASKDYDWGFDAKNIDTQMDDMYWMIGNEKYTIQGIDQINETTTIPIGLQTRDAGINTITIDALVNFPEGLQVYVYDKTLDTYHNLISNDFQIDLPAGEYLERFKITFSNHPLSMEENDIENLEIYFANSTETMVINNPKNLQIEKATLVNMLGQKICSYEDSTNKNYIEYKTKKLSVGTYIIHLKTEIGDISKKVLVK